MTHVRWLPDALDDLKRLHEFIAARNPDAAMRAVHTLLEAAESLSNFPEKGRVWDLATNFRELTVPFGARGYVIRYRFHEGEVIIVRVWHGLEDR